VSRSPQLMSPLFGRHSLAESVCVCMHNVQLSSEEVERRRVRRERNKQAAAKCRQKRVDLTNQLLTV